MGNTIRSVVILGGGSAGWMTATYLSKALQGSVKITLIEAPGIPKLGVGEATVPNLQRVFFDYLGIDEDDWMRACNASYKIGVKFINWRTTGESSLDSRPLRGSDYPDHFYHPFGLLPTPDGIPLSHYWWLREHADQLGKPFDYSCFVEPALMDANRSPRRSSGERVTNYAWHLDAHLLADYLRDFAVNGQGVNHVKAEVSDVRVDERGYITGLETKCGQEHVGDLYIDCSGFRGILINKALGEPFIDMGSQLLCDRAVATTVPYDSDEPVIEPFTSAVAMRHGWTWKIPMQHRIGSGYVYSSEFASQDDATDEFCRLWDLDPNEVNLNHIRFRVGRNRRAWVNNCVSIGASSCFLEPLESTGLYFTYAAVYLLAKHFPSRDFDPVIVNEFNQEVVEMFDETKDFIQSHFFLSPRDDTEFWKAVKNIDLPPSIEKKIRRYQAGIPINPPSTDEGNYYGNFEAEFRNFWTNGSYYSIFTGLDLLPERPLPILEYKRRSVAEAEVLFDQIEQRQQHLVRSQPSAGEYLRTRVAQAGSVSPR